MIPDIDKFNTCRILVVGDLMIDEYLWGNVERISPEAPVQIVTVTSENYTLGGAGNVANNLVALGAGVSVAGVIGTGRDGELLSRRFNDLDVDVRALIQEPTRPTTRKTRIIADNQHVLRIDRETKREISSATRESLSKAIADIIAAVDAVLVSDYGKGLITRELIADLIEGVRKNATPLIVDPKGLDFSKYAGATLVTPNQNEASLAAGIDIVDETSLFAAGTRILDTAGIANVLITCGAEGMALFEHGRAPYRIRTEARQVYDVSGAGDTVLAVLGLCMACGASLAESATLANTAAGIVVGKVGTATVSGAELKAAVNPGRTLRPEKFRELYELPVLIPELRRSGKRIVMTNGCFDLLHAGHIELFCASKALGDVLIVATDDDASVRRLKGPGRPVIRARERVQVLAALDSVDYVVVFSSEQLDELIQIIRPDVLTKGDNYLSEEVAGRQRVEQLGGRVVLIPATENLSSSGIINSIRSG